MALHAGQNIVAQGLQPASILPFEIRDFSALLPPGDHFPPFLASQTEQLNIADAV